jgi:hypothetical protein
VDRVIPAEHRAQHRSWQRVQNRHVRRGALYPSEEPPPFLGTAVRCLKDQGGAARPHPLPRPLKPGNRLSGAAGKPKELTDPAGKTRPDPVRKILRHVDRTACGPRKRPADARGFYHIATGTQPDSPTRQPCGQVGH